MIYNIGTKKSCSQFNKKEKQRERKRHPHKHIPDPLCNFNFRSFMPFNLLANRIYMLHDFDTPRKKNEKQKKEKPFNPFSSKSQEMNSKRMPCVASSSWRFVHGSFCRLIYKHHLHMCGLRLLKILRNS